MDKQRLQKLANITPQPINENFSELKELLTIIEMGEKVGVIEDWVIEQIKRELIQSISRNTKNLPKDKQPIVREVIQILQSARDGKTLRTAIIKVEKIGSKFNEGFMTENQKIKSLLKKGKEWWVKNSYTVVELVATLVVHFIFGVLEGMLKTKLGRPKINFGGKGKFGSGGAGSGGNF